MTLAGDNNIVDGLKWDDDSNFNNLDRAIDVEGTGTIVKNCTFFGFAEETPDAVIIGIGTTSGSDGDNTVVENCTFRKWGTRNTLHLEGDARNVSSSCIQVGRLQSVNSVTGVVIRNNSFLEGPRREYGYNSAIQFYGSALVEYNTFDDGGECIEVKADDITFRYNTINEYSGYNILANRSGRNNLFEFNLVTNCVKVPEKPDASTHAIFVWVGGNTVFRNNIIYNNEKIGFIDGKETSDHPQLTNVLFANNTFVNNIQPFNFRENMVPRKVLGLLTIYFIKKVTFKILLLNMTLQIIIGEYLLTI